MTLLVTVTLTADALAQGEALPPADGVEVIADPEIDAPAVEAEGTERGAAEGSERPSVGEGDAEVIADPELDDGAARSVSATTPGDGEVIADPELDAGSSAGASDGFGSGASTYTDVRGFLATRIGVDVGWSSPREDVFEATQVGQLEMVHHPTDRIGIGLGMRVRHAVGLRESADEGGGRSRTVLDVAPVAGYGDFAIGEVTHLRVGYQILQLGRFDVFSGVNALAVYDLRSGPATMPEANHVAQPAVRLDVDPSEHWSLTGMYVPFFSPHVVDPFGTDYAGLATLEQDARAEIAAARRNPTPQNAELRAFADAGEWLGGAVGRSGIDRLSRGAFGAFAPSPDLTDPQGAARATWHGELGAVSVTGVTALERLPVLSFSDRLLAYPLAGSMATDLEQAFGANPVSLEFGRFWVAAIDGATDLGPVQVGAEAAYMFNRTLTSIGDPPDFTASPPVTFGDLAAALPAPEKSDVAQLSLRAELLQGEGFAVVVEGFGAMALQDPSDPSRHYVFLDGGNRYYGGATGLRWSPDATGLKLELAGAALTGPTFVALPRVEYEVATGLFVELGAVIVEGRAAPITSPDFNVGGLFDATDQVFTGLRWMP